MLPYIAYMDPMGTVTDRMFSNHFMQPLFETSLNLRLAMWSVHETLGHVLHQVLPILKRRKINQFSMLKIDVRLSKINHWIWNSQIRAIKIWLPKGASQWQGLLSSGSVFSASAISLMAKKALSWPRESSSITHSGSVRASPRGRHKWT